MTRENRNKDDIKALIKALKNLNPQVNRIKIGKLQIKYSL